MLQFDTKKLQECGHPTKLNKSKLVTSHFCGNMRRQHKTNIPIEIETLIFKYIQTKIEKITQKCQNIDIPTVSAQIAAVG